MNYLSYIKVNIDDIKKNIKRIKDNYKYNYYCLDVSNNAYGLDLYIVNFLSGLVDYLYTINYQDIKNIIKYKKDIKIIYNGLINEDIVYELILNNIILVIKGVDELKLINEYKLFDQLNIIVQLDKTGFYGINSRNEILNIKNIIKENKKMKLLGVKAINDVDELIDLFDNLELYLLNDETKTNKELYSNGILLNSFVYGFPSKSLFKKSEYKPIYTINSPIIKINTETLKNKTKYYGTIPIGHSSGLNNITKVLINDTVYKVKDIYDEYTVIEIDENISLKDEVIINVDIRSIDSNYFESSIVYEDYELEKFYI